MKKWIVLVLVMLLLAACGEEDSSAGTGELPQQVEVEFNTEETAEPGEEVRLSATVTQGTEAVEDADEVVFEVWQSGARENSEMLEASHTQDGVYEHSWTVEEEGLYFIQAHTTARRMHVMPKMELTVGDPDPETIVPDDSEDSDAMEKMGH
ncbi:MULTISPECIES: FixH family protein [Planococcus]|uniref:YtkA-like protein n=1 Tax=Planococcus citreus TaxID=1373 RepID=A0A497YDU5_9BACL|nr:MULTISPECIES: FixH family protein [Planococcus]MDE0583495.1 FixH family protein [Planococcus sp. A6]RLJ85262.1 YtkA-like protein [Planococcus citreus]